MLNWVKTENSGLSVLPAKAMIDPVSPQPLALITHGHADHARAGHDHVIATPQTLDIMASRYGQNFAQSVTPLAYGETLQLGQTRYQWPLPAASRSVIADFQDQRLVAAGDYKRGARPHLPAV